MKKRTEAKLPFEGILVIDLATLGAAPQIATFFGDLGARVIKVEPPRGDGLRQLVDRRGVALQWQILNRNKECVRLDVATPAGRRALDDLLGRADLLVSNLDRERLRKWKLGAKTLARRFPRLVTVNLTAYGLTGPWSKRPGSGTLAEAAAGLAALTGAADAPPGLSPVGLGDALGALHGIIAALTGLWSRDRKRFAASTSFFDLSMQQPILALLSHRIATAVRDGEEPGRHGNRFPNVAPRNTYRAADGAWVALTAGTDAMCKRVFAAIGRSELAGDERFRSNLSRLANVDALDAIIGDWIAARSSGEVVDELTAAGVSLARCDDLRAVAANEHFRRRGDLVEVDGLTLAAPLKPGRIRWLGRPLGADDGALAAIGAKRKRGSSRRR